MSPPLISSNGSVIRPSLAGMPRELETLPAREAVPLLAIVASRNRISPILERERALFA